MNTNNVLGPKILNHDTFNFAESTIIHPGTSKELDKERSLIKKTTIFTVDSRDRDKGKYISPSKYVIDLDDDIPDVVTAELIQANVPFKTYLVNKYNSQFTMEVNSQEFKIDLKWGNYDPVLFSSTLTETIKNQIPLSFDFKIEYDDVSDKFKFYSDLSFKFLLENKNRPYDPFNLGKIMGFGYRTYTSVFDGTPKFTGLPHVLEGEFRKNFDEKSYILLKISGFNIHHSLSQIIDKTFAIIPERNSSQNNIISDVILPQKNFNPPIAKLSRLQITFIDYNGELVDFQNHDHYFTIKFDSYKHTRKYSTFLDIP